MDSKLETQVLDGNWPEPIEYSGERFAGRTLEQLELEYRCYAAALGLDLDDEPVQTDDTEPPG